MTPVYLVDVAREIYFRGPIYDVKMRYSDKGKVCCLFEKRMNFKELRGLMLLGDSRIVLQPELIQLVTSKLADKYAGIQWKAEEMPSSWVKEKKAYSKNKNFQNLFMR